MKNVFYFEFINVIGGVETMFFELCRKYSNYDITIYYKTGSADQIDRLRQFVRVLKIPDDVLTGKEKIKCEKLFMNYSFNLDWFEYDEAYEIIHADFLHQKNIKPHTDDRLTGYIAVSKSVAASFKEVTGEECTVCYNPISIDEEDRRMKLHFVSATRLTKEKGEFRMSMLARRMREKGIFFDWDVFTHDSNHLNDPCITIRTPKLDIRPELYSADAVIQLSDSEGWCYTINEAMCLGTPVIATILPSIIEMEGKTIFLEHDMSNMDEAIEQIRELARKKNAALSSNKAHYKPKKDIWYKLLAKGESTYRKELSMKYKVRATKEFENVTDTTVGRVRQENEEFIVDARRLDALNSFMDPRGRKVKLIDVVSEIEEPETVEIKPQEEEKPVDKVKTSGKKKTTKKSQKKS